MEQPCSAVSKRQLQVRWRKVAGSKGKARCAAHTVEGSPAKNQTSPHSIRLSSQNARAIQGVPLLSPTLSASA